MDNDGDDDEEEGGEEEGNDYHYQKSLPSTDYNYCSWCYCKHIYTVNLTQRLAMQRYEGLLMSTDVTLMVTATMTMSTVGMKMTM